MVLPTSSGRSIAQPDTGTLIHPLPNDVSKAPIENVLELLPLQDMGQDIFTNARPLVQPPGARGVYGGAVIAQALAAAQLTLPRPSPESNNGEFFVHSMHCYFVLAGNPTMPLLYHVERVRDGKSFVTRTVQARQRGRCIFTTTLSFVREGSAGKEVVEHAAVLPEGAREDLDRELRRDLAELEKLNESSSGGEEPNGPFEARRLPILQDPSLSPDTKRVRQWMRARGSISPSAGHEAHLSALAYMSDSHFIGVVSRVHGLWRFARPPTAANPSSPSSPSSSTATTTTMSSSDSKLLSATAALETLENTNLAGAGTGKRIGMMVSLDHTIYFHRPRAIRADDWLFSEMESPWAGDGRGLVLQKIWNRKGELVATCVQEGLVRLVQNEGPKL